jgi:FG-GAP-like repeat
MAGLPNASRPRGAAWPTLFCVALILSCLLSGIAPFGTAAASPGSPSARLGLVVPQFTIGDFDGDSQPDLASVQTGQIGDTRYFVDFGLSTGLRQTIGVTAPAGGVQLTSRDVNGDSYPDVVVTTSWTNRPVAVLLNDGRGTFTQSAPSAFPGAFATSEDSRIASPDAMKDVAAALFARPIPAECEECGGALSLQIAAGLSGTGALHFTVSSNTDSFFGRAPPSLARHN